VNGSNGKQTGVVSQIRFAQRVQALMAQTPERPGSGGYTRCEHARALDRILADCRDTARTGGVVVTRLPRKAGGSIRRSTRIPVGH
jgi:hypothetical protein